MKTGPARFFRRSVLLAAAGVLAVVLTACTGVGGGYLPPQSPDFSGQASLGLPSAARTRAAYYLYLDAAWKPAPPIAPATGQFTFVDLLRYAGAA